MPTTFLTEHVFITSVAQNLVDFYDFSPFQNDKTKKKEGKEVFTRRLGGKHTKKGAK